MAHDALQSSYPAVSAQGWSMPLGLRRRHFTDEGLQLLRVNTLNFEISATYMYFRLIDTRKNRRNIKSLSRRKDFRHA